METSKIIFPAAKKIPIRDGFGEGLVEVGKKNSNVVVLSADLTQSTRTHWFKEEFPDRFIEVGVAEQNLVTVASGMAAVGKIPFIASYAIFSPGRNWEQIRTTVCYNNQPVKIIGSHAGLLTGADGATHQALEDIALTRTLPNMAVIVPADYVEARKAVKAAVTYPKPVYIRLTRPKTPVFTTPETSFEFGQAQVLRKGSDISLISCGPTVYLCLEAAEKLSRQKISAEVINVSTIKPLDSDSIISSTKKTGRVITVEDHQINGGLGGAVAEIVSEQSPTKMKRIGVTDRFGQSGDPEKLWQEYGLTVENIINSAEQLIV